MLPGDILRSIQNMTRQYLVRETSNSTLSMHEPHIYPSRTTYHTPRTTHYTVARGTPARGGYPLHSPLSHYSTHSSPSTHSILYSEGLPTHDPISCPPLSTPYLVLGTRYWTGAMAMARDHGSIALHARYARPKGYLYLLCTVHRPQCPYPYFAQNRRSSS
jgi:hypothetical protein